METSKQPSALELLQQDFLECRSRLLEIAAFLDRIDRYPDAELARRDHRYQALEEVLELLSTGRGQRTRTSLMLLSDPTVTPGPAEHGAGEAVGAWRDPHAY